MGNRGGGFVGRVRRVRYVVRVVYVGGGSKEKATGHARVAFERAERRSSPKFFAQVENLATVPLMFNDMHQPSTSMIPKDARTLPWQGLSYFVEITSSNSTNDWVYRGQAQAKWPLQPKAGRKSYNRALANGNSLQNPLLDDDLRLFSKWRDLAVAYTDKLPKEELECLAYAQHYGLATRLLDWTLNPLVALYFAVEDHDDEDGVIYSLSVGSKHKLSPDQKLSQRFFGLSVFQPRPFDRRIFAQQGLFTYHPEPAAEFPVYREPNPHKVVNVDGKLQEVPTDEVVSDLIAWTIPKGEKFGLMRRLQNMGYSRSLLFPDLDGLSSTLNWEARKDVINFEVLRGLMAQAMQNPSPQDT